MQCHECRVPGMLVTPPASSPAVAHCHPPSREASCLQITFLLQSVPLGKGFIAREDAALAK